MTLIDWSSQRKTTAVTAKDSGMATKEIKVVRTDSKNANRTMATITAPSRSACVHLWFGKPFGKARLKINQGLLNLSAQLDRISGRLLLNAENHSRLTLITSITALETSSEANFSHLLQ
jgi:hypothetical protein